jgi:ATP-dependent DNA ligase
LKESVVNGNGEANNEANKKLPCVVLFDILVINGQNVCNQDLLSRKQLLSNSVTTPAPFIQTSYYKTLSPDQDLGPLL